MLYVYVLYVRLDRNSVLGIRKPRLVVGGVYIFGEQCDGKDEEDSNSNSKPS